MVIRQVVFAVGLQVVASTALLALGGWLVIDGQLTLGQLVASELVVTVVVGAFAKAGKSLEKFYDLMAGIDKVGHLLEHSDRSPTRVGEIPDLAADIRWSDLVFETPSSRSTIPAADIPPGPAWRSWATTWTAVRSWRRPWPASASRRKVWFRLPVWMPPEPLPVEPDGWSATPAATTCSTGRCVRISTWDESVSDRTAFASRSSKSAFRIPS